MNHKRFFQLFDSILLITALVLSIYFFKSSFTKTFDDLHSEPVIEAEEMIDDNVEDITKSE